MPAKGLLCAKSCPWQARDPTSASPPNADLTRKSRHVRKVPTGDIAFSSVAPRLPAQSSTFKTTMAISVATIMPDIVTNPNTKKIGSCEKIT
jgi:hypothetical protein